jgi:O-glycosyl hydrolase
VSGTQHYVIVAINANTFSVTMSFTLNNGTVTSLTPNQSPSAAGLAPESAVTVMGGQFSYTLPGTSTTMLVQ